MEVRIHESDTKIKSNDRLKNNTSQRNIILKNTAFIIISSIIFLSSFFIYSNYQTNSLKQKHQETTEKLNQLKSNVFNLSQSLNKFDASKSDSVNKKAQISELIFEIKNRQELLENTFRNLKNTSIIEHAYFKLKNSLTEYKRKLNFQLLNDKKDFNELNAQRLMLLNTSALVLENKISEQKSSLTLSFNKETNKIHNLMMYAAFLLIVSILLIVLRAYIQLTNTIGGIKKFISTLSEGKLPKRIDQSKHKNQDLRIVSNQLRENLKIASRFANKIGKSEFDSEFKPASKNDVLGNALLTMRKQLKKVHEEDKQRNWLNEGRALFSKILRKQDKDLSQLSDEIISKLVNYTECNQGAVYIIEETLHGESSLVMKACYAYGRKKHLNKNVEIGEGILGQAYLDKSIIYMTDIPENYLQIKSGLGESKPKSLILIPLINNNKVEGIIELSSFKELCANKMDFLEQVATDIASNINAIKTNDKTKFLLEESQKQAENLRVQEEELRQNMEELRATHEQLEVLRRESERHSEEKIKQAEENNQFIISILNSLPSKIFLKDEQFRMSLINDAVCQAHGLSREELIGKSDEDFFGKQDGSILIAEEQAIIRGNKPVTWEHEDLAQGKRKVMKTTKMPFKLGKNRGTGLLGFQVDVTEKVSLEQKIKKLETELSTLKSE